MCASRDDITACSATRSWATCSSATSRCPCRRCRRAATAATRSRASARASTARRRSSSASPSTPHRGSYACLRFEEGSTQTSRARESRPVTRVVVETRPRLSAGEPIRSSMRRHGSCASWSRDPPSSRAAYFVLLLLTAGETIFQYRIPQPAPRRAARPPVHRGALPPARRRRSARVRRGEGARDGARLCSDGAAHQDRAS